MAAKQKEEEHNKELERASPKQEQVTEMVKRGMLLGNPTYNLEKTHLTWDYYLSTMKII